MTQLSITAIDNKNLFSNYYLDNQIKNNPEWKKDEHKAAFSEVKKLYDTEKDFLPSLNEKQLEQRFFAPIFKILNHTVEVNEGTESQEFPDYAFFPDRNSLDDAHKNKGTISFYNNAFAIGEVKRWGIELDRFGRDEKDRKRNPSLQIWIYLHDVSPKWGVLSNGAKWRLYCKDRRRDDYYEVDLPTLLAKDEPKNVEDFKYFYYFFRKDAFLPSQDGDPFLDRVLRGSADYAKEIGDDLKENVYKAMKKVAEGFFNWTQNGLDVQKEEARETVQKSTMLLLYRFLFLLYAEGKGLLDIGKPRYRESYSFYKLKNEVKEKQDGPMQQRYLPVGTTLWFRLKDLFRLINQGSEAFGIPKSELYVPAYNGGLFDPDKNPELEKWVIGDALLADAIDLLSRSKVNGGRLDFVDYSTLEIRHLGSIYEGLLEYKLRIADEDMVVNGGEWVNISDYNKDRKQKKVFSVFDEFDRVKKGQIYLATDKGERKATGSYYTPDYIVNYIVKNTVGPVVDEKWKEAEAKKQSFIEATLSVKVLDPAMGSGHFLVGSIEFLAVKLLLAAQKDIEAGRLSEDAHLTSDWARREVVAHCIYGVDLNDLAVELAKVSLWLTTISKDKPLSFLDHRLKQGNSLIGAKLEDLSSHPDVIVKKKERKIKDAAQQTFEVEIERPFFDKIVKILNNLTDINDDSIENIYKKKDIFEKLIASPEYQRIKALANLHTAIYFGVVTTKVDKEPKDGYNDILWALRENEDGWRKKTNREWFGKARRLAEDKSFFHWELEFPELFFEGGAPKENPGWDAVVGNPPYVNAIELNKVLSEYEKPFWKTRFQSAEGAYDLYILFYEQALNLAKKGYFVSYITPNKFLSAPYAVAFRKYIFQNHRIISIGDFSRIKVFQDPSVYPIITIFKKSKAVDNYKLDVIFTSENGIPSVIQQSSENLSKLPEFIWGFLLSFYFNTLLKIEAISEPISKTTIVQATSTAAESDEFEGALHNGLQGKSDYKFINTGLIDRYDSLWGIQELTHKGKQYYEPYLDISNSVVSTNRQKLFKTKKIIFAKMALRLECFIDLDGEYASANTNCVYDTKYNLLYYGALLNSTLMTFVYSGYFGALIMSGGYFQFQAPQIQVLPIRRISFTTPPDRRASLVEQAKALYSEFLGAPDSQKLLDFVGARLEAKPEESDVTHDLLAHLAERMIEMNKEKNAEIKSFLEFLKGEIGAPIEELSNKTAIQEYYEHEFQNLIDVLAKNKKKLKAGYDPKSPANYKHLQQWYNDSTGKLKPLMGRIEAADGLIDAIVYKLYGLTDDEIKIVEGSISGEKHNEELKS